MTKRLTLRHWLKLFVALDALLLLAVGWVVASSNLISWGF